jgi:hypothetical protein
MKVGRREQGREVLLLDLEQVAVIPDHLLLSPLAHEVVDGDHAAFEECLEITDARRARMLDLDVVKMLVRTFPVAARPDPEGLGMASHEACLSGLPAAPRRPDPPRSSPTPDPQDHSACHW